MKLKQWSTKHIFIFNIIIIIISMSMLATSSAIFTSQSQTDKFLLNLFGRFLPATLLLILACHLQVNFSIRFQPKKILMGFLSCWPILFAHCVFQLYLFLSNHANFDTTPSALKLVILVFSTLCIGYFEEMLFRGVVLGSFIKKWGSQNHGILKAAIVSSCMFGFLHFSNIFRFPGLYLTILSQGIFATLFAIYFASSYLRTKNIWSIALVHAIVDLVADLLDTLSSKMRFLSAHDITLTQSILSIVIILPFAIVAIKRLKDAKPQE